MGYVRSRKFCCCLPVRFGVFCMAFIGLGLGGLIAIAGWVEVHNVSTGQVEMDHDQKIALWLVSLTYTWMALVSFVGLIGSLTRSMPLIVFYAYTVTVNTLVIIAAGIYLVWSLFHKRGEGDVDHCVGSTTGEVGEVKHWVCQKGFDVLRILVVVVMCIIWIFQLVGIFIVFDYRGQLREEQELEKEQTQKLQPYKY